VKILVGGILIIIFGLQVVGIVRLPFLNQGKSGILTPAPRGPYLLFFWEWPLPWAGRRVSARCWLRFWFIPAARTIYSRGCCFWAFIPWGWPCPLWLTPWLWGRLPAFCVSFPVTCPLYPRLAELYLIIMGLLAFFG